MMPTDPKDRARVVKEAKADGWCFYCENPVTVRQYEQNHKSGQCRRTAAVKSGSVAKVASAGEIGQRFRDVFGIETDLQTHERLAKSANDADLRLYHENAAKKLQGKGK